MTVAVKICGINTMAAADAACRAGADFGGLVFFARSPRAVTVEAGAALAARLRPAVKVVALAVDAEDAALGEIAARVRPDFFQLHGRETPRRVAEIRARFAIPVIKALAVADADSLAAASAYDGVADLLLFDAPAAPDAARPGGHGTAFDWRLLKEHAVQKPWFLAGGLTPDNVARALAVSGARMVDVSSGVESAPGIKSESLIAAFVAAARQSPVIESVSETSRA